jgi:hypothetical protein
MPIALAVTPRPEGEENTILGRIEWNTKTGKLIRVDRMKDTSGNWVSDKVDISTIEKTDGSLVRPSMLFDFASAQNGWVRFSPYDEVMVGIAAPLPVRPPQYLDQNGQPVMDTYGKPIRHDQMVRIPVYSTVAFPDMPLRELSIRGMHAISALGELFGQVENAPEYLAGKLPLIRWDKARDVGKGNGAPSFAILSWHDRPAGMPLRAGAAAPVAPATTAPAPQPAAQPAQVVNQMPPPVAAAPAMMEPAPFAPEVR